MTTRLGALADRVSGQAFGLTNYDQLEANENYMTVAGVDIASAATINITNRFHGVTGTTSISTITDLLGAVEGQIVELWIKNGPLTIQSGTGNIKTATGANRTAYPGEVIGFRYGSDAVWHEVRPMPGALIAAGTKTAPVSTASTSFSTGVDLLAAALSLTADGVSNYLVKVAAPHWFNTATATTYLSLNLDGADQGYIASVTLSSGSIASPCTFESPILAPAAGVHTVNARLVVAAGTATVEGGSGGAAALRPILVTLEVL